MAYRSLVRPSPRCTALVALVATLALAAAAGAATPAQIVAALNAERAANGIPAGIRLNSGWSKGCAAHIRYETLNHLPFTHVEIPGNPGHTSAGALAGKNGDQAMTDTSFDTGNPFENLPYHMVTLLAPMINQAGAFESNGRDCIQLGTARTFPRDAVYSDPGPGAVNVVTSQVVRGEVPLAPGDLVGLPQGTRTGPHIYLFGAGPWVENTSGPLTVVSAKLSGPSGRSVALRTVDGRRFPQTFLGPYHAAVLIPVEPLGGGVYRVAVTLRAGRVSFTRKWEFSTTALPAARTVALTKIGADP
jgi:hypothetical protein